MMTLKNIVKNTTYEIKGIKILDLLSREEAQNVVTVFDDI